MPVPRLDNDRHEAFARTYVATWSVEAAGKACNYTANTAAHLSRDASIVERVRELTDKLLQAHDITAARVMLELARVGFSDIRKIVDGTGRLLPLVELDDDIAAAISGVEVETRLERETLQDLATGENVTRMTPVVTTKVKKSDKVAALNILAKHFKLVGDEGDGVNALASALSDRLQAARRRVALSGADDARIIDHDTAERGRSTREALPEPRHGDRPDATRQRDDGRGA